LKSLQESTNMADIGVVCCRYVNFFVTTATYLTTCQLF